MADDLTKDYSRFVDEVSDLLEVARRQASRSVNAILTSTYWEIGRRIVEYEQEGKERAGYGENLLERLAVDLTKKFGRGFSRQNLQYMRQFYLFFPPEKIRQTMSDKFSIGKCQTVSGKSVIEPKLSLLSNLTSVLSLSWSHYVLLISRSLSPESMEFYHTEALRGGWSVRQLQRQIDSQFYERTILSKNKAAMLVKGAKAKPQDALTPDEEVKDPYVLEFLGLKDEYSENELEEALIRHLETFLLELGGDFCFIGRQKRLRIGDEWYRVDIVFFHRRLKCLVVIDLKLGKFTHADAGQMHMYLNYAAENWTHPGENPPVGLILCAQKNEALVHYALDKLPNKVLAAEYRTALPDEKLITKELERTRKLLEKCR